MASRDPDTGQFVESSEERTINYNDLNYQYVGFKRLIGGSPTEEGIFQIETEPIDERELDHNQLAELVYMRRHMFTQVEVTGDIIDQTETGNAETVVTFEVNSGEQEWLNSDQRGAEYVEENNRNFDLNHMAVQVPFNEAGDSGGGGGGGPPTSTAEREVMFAGPNGLFHRGPVLDANDTLNFRYEIDLNNCVYDVRLKTYYVLGWRLHEVENARPEFGIPL